MDTLMRTLINLSVQVAILLAVSLTSTSAYSCAVPSDSYFERRKQSHIRIYEEVCSGKDQKEVAKIKAGFKRDCKKHTAKLESATEEYNANHEDTQAETEVMAYQMLVDANCDHDQALKDVFDDNYKRAIKCGYFNR